MGRTPRPEAEKAREQARLERIGRSLKALRKSKGLTAQDLADQLGVKSQYIYMIESGRARPTERRLKELANALGGASAEAFLEVAVTQVEAEFADRLRTAGLSPAAIEDSAKRVAERAVLDVSTEESLDDLDFDEVDRAAPGIADRSSALGYAASVADDFESGVRETRGARRWVRGTRGHAIAAGPDAHIVVQRPLTTAEREALTDVAKIVERLLDK